LKSEVLNTQRHQSSWGSGHNLRNVKVNFISAGGYNPSEEFVKVAEPESSLADMTLEDAPDDRSQQPDERLPITIINQYIATRDDTSVPDNPSPLPTAVASETLREAHDTFVIDTNGSRPIPTGLPPPQIRSLSPTPPDSSDEDVVLFAGRDSTGRGIRRATPPPRKKRVDLDVAKIRIVEDKIQHQKDFPVETNIRPLTPGSVVTHTPAEMVREGEQGLQHLAFGTDIEAANKERGPSMKRVRRSRNAHRNQISDRAEQAIIDDYIANMDDEEMDQITSFNKRDLGGHDSDAWQETDTSSLGHSAKTTETVWNRTDLRDFDDLSTSGEVLGTLQAILSKRTRKSGMQYLVVWCGQGTDEARWVPHSNLTEPAALLLVEKFEAEEKLMAEVWDAEDDDNSDSDGDSDDELDLIQRKIDHMTDEKIARLLAKQEELGMGSHELVLFDDSADGEDEVLDIAVRHSSRPTRSTSGRSKRPRGDYPAASLLDNSYDGFDVMDFERPSLKKKPKGRKGKVVFDISDSELEASMQMAWNNDRVKKRERKEKREELRAQGLLGKKHGKPDLKAKYKEGMGIHGVKDEIKDFLMGGNTTWVTLWLSL
jgi:hypothetical protein